MKVTVDIDCTPEEARTLPRPARRQADAGRDHARDGREDALGLTALGPEEAMRMWLPAGMQAAEQFQKLFAQFYGVKRD